MSPLLLAVYKFSPCDLCIVSTSVGTACVYRIRPQGLQMCVTDVLLVLTGISFQLCR